MDHSAYDSYAVLVEADGKRLFYSGDFRAHGRKACLVERLIADPPTGVDVLLMEGTTIGRPDADQGLPKETDLEDRMVELFRQTPGMPLVWCSGQNIDRLVTVFRACKRANRQFIIDMYTAHVLRATGNENVPQADWHGIKVFLPESQKRQIKQKGEFALAKSYRPYRIFPERLAEAAPTSVMLFRPSMMRDVEAAKCLEGSRLICSIWSGYLRDEKHQRFLGWLKSRGIPMDECHTSGHACMEDLVRLRQAFPEAAVMPIHTERPDRFEEGFGNVQQWPNDDWWETT